LIALKPLPQARQARTPEHKLQRARSARQMRPPSKGGGCGVTATSWADPNRRFQSLALRVHASGGGWASCPTEGGGIGVRLRIRRFGPPRQPARQMRAPQPINENSAACASRIPPER
jgi:hypothetical protein